MDRDRGAAGEAAAKQEKAAAKKKTPSLDNESFRPEVDDETRRQQPPRARGKQSKRQKERTNRVFWDSVVRVGLDAGRAGGGLSLERGTAVARGERLFFVP